MTVETGELRAHVKRAARGDRDAAAALFDAYHPRLYRYALAKLRDPIDAQDVAAETFARVLRDLDRFRWRGAGFEAWIFRIAANLITDHLRRSGREMVTEISDEEHGGLETRTPESLFLDLELRGELGAMVQHLPEEQREVVLLRFAAGLDSAETGKAMDRNANAVRQLQFRALQNLRRMVRQEVEAT